MKNAGSLYNKDKMNVELSSIYLGIWPHYIGNPHTNERDLSAGIDRLPRACLTSLADLSLQLHTTSGVAEIYICNTRKALIIYMKEGVRLASSAPEHVQRRIYMIPVADLMLHSRDFVCCCIRLKSKISGVLKRRLG